MVVTHNRNGIFRVEFQPTDGKRTDTPVTEDMFNIFKQETEYWLHKLGLVSYETHIESCTLDDYVLGECHWNVVSRNVLIRMCATWSVDTPTACPDEYNIRRVAYHEVMHLLLCPFQAYGTDINLGEAQKSAELLIVSHTVIKTLENTMFNDDHHRRVTKGEITYA